MEHCWDKITEPPFSAKEDSDESSEWNTSNYAWYICKRCGMIQFLIRRINTTEHLAKEGYYINKKYYSGDHLSCGEVIMKDVLE